MGSHGNTVLDSGGPLSVQPNGAAALQRLAVSSIQQHSRRQVSHDLDRAGKFRPSNALSRFYGATPSWRAATYLPRLSRAICGQPYALSCCSEIQTPTRSASRSRRVSVLVMLQVRRIGRTGRSVRNQNGRVIRSTSVSGHSLPARAGDKSSHVRCAAESGSIFRA